MMTDRALLALAERVEKAEGADRELDAEIAETLGIRVIADHYEDGSVAEYYDWPARTSDGEDPGPNSVVEYYTASLDAALTLAPEGWHTTHASWDNLRAHLTLGHADRELRYRHGSAATPALALCAAALRARAEADD